MAQPTDLTAIQIEIERLWADITTTLVALVILQETTMSVSVVYLFASNKHIQSSYRKRPHKDDDVDIICSSARLTEQEELELVLRESRQEEER